MAQADPPTFTLTRNLSTECGIQLNFMNRKHEFPSARSTRHAISPRELLRFPHADVTNAPRLACPDDGRYEQSPTVRQPQGRSVLRRQTSSRLNTHPCNQ